MDMKSKLPNVNCIGFIKKSEGGSKHQSNSVYSPSGLSPCICANGEKVKAYTFILVKK